MASQLYTLIVKSAPAKGDKSRLHSVFTDLKSTIEIEQRFSDSRCLKVLQFADKAYRENLPEHYTEGVHHEQVILRYIMSQVAGDSMSCHEQQAILCHVMSQVAGDFMLCQVMP